MRPVLRNRELAGSLPRDGQKQPPSDVCGLNLEVAHRRTHAPPEFVPTVFQANQQHPASAEDVLSRQRPSRRECEKLCNANRGFARTAFGKVGTDVASAE